MKKIDINKRYRELISVLLQEMDDEEKLHELYVYALTISNNDYSEKKVGY